MLNFAALRTPEQDGQTLIEPEPARLAEAVAANRERIGDYAFSILDETVSTVRQATRVALGLSAGPVIATGHQPELIHPGVWAKHIVTSRLAAALGGTALNLVVDNDSPKTQGFIVPGVHDDVVRAERIEIPNLSPGYAYEHRTRLVGAQVDALRARVKGVMGDAFAATHLDLYFKAWAGQTADCDLVDQTIAARQAIERYYRVDLLERRVSSCWPHPLAAHIMLDASRFAARYNEALSHYRRAYRVRGKNRPIPDLVARDGAVELPFWLYGPDEPRRRVFVRASGGHIELMADTEPVGRLDAAGLAKTVTAAETLASLTPRVLRPRALLLTLWTRLFVADLFVHGIGGAKYDRITDALITGYFGVEPPVMACVSATLRLPLTRARTTAADLRVARYRRRDLNYNPQRYLRRTPEVVTLTDRRAAAIARSSQLRADEPNDHRRRKETYDEIHALNASMVAIDPT